MPRIATLTMNPSLDMNTTVERGDPDEKIRCAPPTQEVGGGGLNVSRVAVRLGEASHAVLTAGGAIGEMLTDLIRDEGMDPIPVEVSGSTRQNPTFSETRTDRQYRFVMPGPRMSETECDAVLETLAALDPAPEYLVASGSLPPGAPDDFYARLADEEHARGCRHRRCFRSGPRRGGGTRGLPHQAERR